MGSSPSDISLSPFGLPIKNVRDGSSSRSLLELLRDEFLSEEKSKHAE